MPRANCCARSSTAAIRPRARPRRGCCATCDAHGRHARRPEAGTRAKRRLARMRYALGVEYDGSGFSGWQRLNRPGEPERRNEPTLQAALEQALSFVAGHGVETVCAGRTDAGV